MTSTHKSKTPCRHEKDCWKVKSKKGCPYLHTPSNDSFRHQRTNSSPAMLTNCRHGPNCAFRNKGCNYDHDILCRDGNKCSRDKCIYVHYCSAIAIAGNPCCGKVSLGYGTWRCLNHQRARLPR